MRTLAVVATHQVKNTKKYFLINDFKDVLFHFKTAIAMSTFFIGLTAFFIVYMYSSEEYRDYLKNIIFVGMIVSILGLVAYQLKLAARLLDVNR